MQNWIRAVQRRWHGAEIDADPFALPAHIAIPAQAAITRMLGFIRFAAVGRKGVEAADSSPILGRFEWKEPIKAYQGLALRRATRSRHDLRAIVLIEMIHRTDTGRSIILHVSFDGADVAARWRSWSNMLGLPLLVERKDGSLEPAERRMGSVKLDSPQPHAGANPLTLRRPMTFGATGRPRIWTQRLCAGSRPHSY
jgi:hypothetical protein